MVAQVGQAQTAIEMIIIAHSSSTLCVFNKPNDSYIIPLMRNLSKISKISRGIITYFILLFPLKQV